MTFVKAPGPRRGLTSVAVLFCLVVVMLIGAALVRIALTQRGFDRDLERRLQAEWLVESGVERALARLDADRGYAGETWSISSEELGTPREGRPAGIHENADPAAAIVTITVDRPPGAAGRGKVRVQADYPRDGPGRSRQSQEISLDLEPGKPGVKS